METTPHTRAPSAVGHKPSPSRDLRTVDLPAVGLARRSLAGVAALATLPYLCLKLAWLSGSPIGLGDTALATDPTMMWLNALTLLLDAVALGLAITFMTRRGLRAPAWLVVPPMWIGAGLLGQILLSLPVALVLRAASPSQVPAPAESLPIAGWIFALVYTGFALLGLGLLSAFALYARQRWGARRWQQPTSLARRALLGSAGLVVAAALVHLAVSDVPLDSRLLDLVVALVGAASLVALTRPRLRGGSARAAVVVAFVATGAMAAWGTYLAVITGVPNDLVGQVEIDWATVGASLGRAVAGLASASALILRFSPRRPPRKDVRARHEPR